MISNKKFKFRHNKLFIMIFIRPVWTGLVLEKSSRNTVNRDLSLSHKLDWRNLKDREQNISYHRITKNNVREFKKFPKMYF